MHTFCATHQPDIVWLQWHFSWL